MFQIRIHGRGGQGVVTAAELLSVAAFQEQKFSQAFPSFGSERMGAPVMAFCRIDDRPIRLREPVFNPNALIIQDPTLLHQVDLFSGLDDAGYVLINSSHPLAELRLDSQIARLRTDRVRVVPATQLAQQFVKRAVPNVPLLGGLMAMTGLLKLESLAKALADKFPAPIAKANLDAATAAFDLVSAPQLGHAGQGGGQCGCAGQGHAHTCADGHRHGHTDAQGHAHGGGHLHHAGEKATCCGGQGRCRSGTAQPLAQPQPQHA